MPIICQWMSRPARFCSVCGRSRGPAGAVTGSPVFKFPVPVETNQRQPLGWFSDGEDVFVALDGPNGAGALGRLVDRQSGRLEPLPGRFPAAPVAFAANDDGAFVVGDAVVAGTLRGTRGGWEAFTGWAPDGTIAAAATVSSSALGVLVFEADEIAYWELGRVRSRRLARGPRGARAGRAWGLTIDGSTGRFTIGSEPGTIDTRRGTITFGFAEAGKPSGAAGVRDGSDAAVVGRRGGRTAALRQDWTRTWVEYTATNPVSGEPENEQVTLESSGVATADSMHGLNLHPEFAPLLLDDGVAVGYLRGGELFYRFAPQNRAAAIPCPVA